MTEEESGYDAKKAAEEYKTKQVDQWHAEWKAYEFKIGESENLAMAPYVNHERKTAQER